MGLNTFNLRTSSVTPFAATEKHDGDVAAHFALINDINTAMHKEFSHVVKYEPPCINWIDLFNDNRAEQQMPNVVVVGIMQTLFEDHKSYAAPAEGGVCRRAERVLPDGTGSLRTCRT